jgi:hypothetical protein
MALVRTCDRCSSDQAVSEYRVCVNLPTHQGFDLFPDLCEHCKEQLIRFLNGSYSYDESEEDSDPSDSKKDKQHEQVATQEELLSGILRLWDSYFGTLKP